MPSRRVVRVFGPLPPPVHGASRVTRLVADLVAAEPDVRVRKFDSNDGVRAAARLGRMLRGLASLALGRGGSVYVGGAGGELLWYQAVVVLLARARRQRIVFHHHNFSYLHERSTAMAALCRIGGGRLRHVVLGATMAQAMRASYPAATDVRVVSNAALLGDPVAAPRDVSGPLVLGHLSNLSRDKGLDLVIESARRLRGAGVDATLVLAGPCADSDAELLVEQGRRDLGDALEVLGRIDADRVSEVYERIDLFVFPSRYRNEAEPLVVLDAMRHGVETVGFDTGCVGELVATGFAVPRDGDLPTVVAEHAGARRGRTDAADRYARRRAEAQTGLAELVAHLAG
ncbi:MAG: glycosyltransferase family 4 protein [Aeromicrobium sp.]|uniref:glycosyltransferase family 4 protein n=1 Tax=Aeromicrobium sp. TaxID=1871063 RepID=UPI0026142DEC|nr:glycosyltransferase family 4 protein [Aeromicrobium sp.]MDF1704805.1 glycosyltransferase family 4 protein [Aeromicrobium sp.]